MKKLTIVFTVIFLCTQLLNFGQRQKYSIDPDIYFSTMLEFEDIVDYGDIILFVVYSGSNMVLNSEHQNRQEPQLNKLLTKTLYH